MTSGKEEITTTSLGCPKGQQGILLGSDEGCVYKAQIYDNEGINHTITVITITVTTLNNIANMDEIVTLITITIIHTIIRCVCSGRRTQCPHHQYPLSSLSEKQQFGGLIFDIFLRLDGITHCLPLCLPFFLVVCLHLCIFVCFPIYLAVLSEMSWSVCLSSCSSVSVSR
jgi:hypothetical protein